ncbi:hypothetical protein ILUMI_05456 [Ignelater luminosus]|uniref:GH18 domain-containing protein n=1 Tax=Ignelater luminosus TaxID=2038154 RepID=A0A8K0DB15_IGNLU|nr:hypothetical protein ILUMI_05456 [Ignelater luminosus]
MTGNSWLYEILFLSILLAVIATDTISERHCTTHSTTNYAERNSNKLYIKHGDSFNLNCVLNEEHYRNLSNNIYFTRDNELLPNDMIQVLSGTAVRLHVKKPPKSESLYECRLKDYTKPICLNIVVVDARPLFVTDIDCISYNQDNFICTWTQPKSYVDITYDVKYYFPDNDNNDVSSDNDLILSHPNKCPNVIYHKDTEKMSCLGTLDRNSYVNDTQRPFYLNLEMINVFGITTVHKTVSNFYCVRSGSSQDSTSQSEESTPVISTSEQVTLPHPTTEASVVDRNSPFKVVCYLEGRARMLEGIAKFLPNNIDSDLCTHIVYVYAILDEINLTLKPEDDLRETEKDYYKNITALRTKGIKVVLGFVGWTESIKEKYSRLINDPTARKKFIANAIEYIRDNNFDGLELAWFYPKCWHGYCNKGPESDKPAFAAFIKELHDAFAPRNLLLSAHVSRRKIDADSGYDVPTLSRYLDWITVMCFNYQGHWTGVTGHVASLYVHDDDKNVETNSNFTIHYYIDKGADRNKLIMGMATFGQYFTLTDSNKNGLYALTNGGRPYSNFEICKLVTKEWTIVQDEKKTMGPYAYFENQWLSFDDIAMMQRKSEYIKSMGLGGAMIWSLNAEDFDNVCGCGSYPLLKTINRVLRNYTKPIPNCQIQVDYSPQPE